jgi:SAM-dependent methyltransferase
MIRKFLPTIVRNPLWGNREKYGLNVDVNDKDWMAWLNFYNEFYTKTQKEGRGETVNNWGYQVIENINLNGMSVLEIGAGNLPHRRFWRGLPTKYHLVDVDDNFLQQQKNKLYELKIDTQLHHVKRGEVPVIKDGSVDVIFTFYSLEHLFDLDKQLQFYYKKLKKGGYLIGAIPNEGGLAWGMGRFLTTRRFVHKNTNINYDKIICWEHPNFCDDILKTILETGFLKKRQFGYPFGFLAPKDFNLVTSFIYEK